MKYFAAVCLFVISVDLSLIPSGQAEEVYLINLSRGHPLSSRRPRIQVFANSLPDGMLREAISVASDAIHRFGDWSDRAKFMKYYFEEYYGGEWNCFMNQRNQGYYAVQPTPVQAFFTVQGVDVGLSKMENECQGKPEPEEAAPSSEKPVTTTEKAETSTDMVIDARSATKFREPTTSQATSTSTTTTTTTTTTETPTTATSMATSPTPAGEFEMVESTKATDSDEDDSNSKSSEEENDLSNSDPTEGYPYIK
ncbi:hypothetical protein HDE_06935 [Halotydeus destructor]|nr:hypothetical protein HDE_06935 [Halotydeus destructor]